MRNFYNLFGLLRAMVFQLYPGIRSPAKKENQGNQENAAW